MSNRKKRPPKRSRKRKRTAEEKRARCAWRASHMRIFVNGRQKWVKRPPEIDGLPVEEFIARNADPIWLHEHGYWELIDDESGSYATESNALPGGHPESRAEDPDHLPF